MPSPNANDGPAPDGAGLSVGVDSGPGGEAGGGAPKPPAKFLYPSGSRPLDGYTIKRGIGRGGFGEVYFATSDAGKEVALKLIRRNLDVELRGVRQCLNLKHPNLVALYDLKGDDAGDQWVVMEYVALGAGGGLSLEEAIAAHPNGMREAELLHWIKGIAAGVGYLHASGIVHRDLKPGNIFRDVATAGGDGGGYGDVKIGDYGLSKFISCSRRSGQTESVGTVHYMAPEIANGRYGREVDLYALGIILYEMLTGRVPFEGESIGEVLMKHLTAEPDLSVLKRPYRDIVRRLLAKDPEERIASVTEMIQLLPGERTVAGPEAPTSGEFPAYDAEEYDAEEFVAAPEGNPFGHAGPEAETAYAPNPGAAPSDAPPQDAEQGEPLWCGLRDGWRQLRDGWADWDAPPLVRGLVLFGVVAAALALGAIGFATRLLPMLLMAYFAYYVVWSLLAPKRRSPPPTPTADPRSAKATGLAPAPKAAAQPAAEPPLRPGHARQARRVLRKTWREAAKQQVLAKSFRQNTQELLGSMLLSALICLVLSGICVGAAGEFLNNGRHGSEAFPWFVWVTITTTLGCWAVLLTSKVTEGRVEDRIPMRGILLASGAVIGLLVGVISTGLPVELPLDRNVIPGPHATDSLMGEIGPFTQKMNQAYSQKNPLAVGGAVSAGYFALMFCLVRWWRLAEYTRDKRLSLWSVAACVFGAWLVHLLWWYPMPTGVVVAGIVAVAVQLSSPWLPPSKREAFARGEVV